MRPSYRVVWLAFLAYLVSQIHIAVLVAPLKPTLLALQLAFTSERFWQVLHLWGPQGLALFRSHFVFDLVHPLLYASFGYLAGRSKLFAGLSVKRQATYAVMLPLAAMFDYAENLSHWALLSFEPLTGGVLIGVASFCAALKWLLACVFVGGLISRLLSLKPE
jgi:hypothetical protein